MTSDPLARLGLDALPELLAGIPELQREVAELRAEVEVLRRRSADPLADLATPEQIAESGLVKMGTLREYLLDRDRNGLAQHVTRPPEGRRLYISRRGFARWLRQRSG